MNKGLKITHIIVLVLFCYVFFFHGLGSYSLKEPDEGRYAEIPREMNELGDYTVPHLNYVRYFEKPPLLYWACAASYKVFGTNEWGFRVPNALAASLCLFALYFFVRRWFSEKTAFLSAVILATSIGFFSLARIVTTDMLFSCMLFLSLLFFRAYYREKKPLFIYFFYAAAGLSTLAKGPVALILLGAVIIIFLFTERNLAFIREMKPLRGILIYAAVTLPWIIAISLREKEFLYFFIVDQHFLRFLTSKHKRSGPLYYFLPVLLGGLFPWSILIPRALGQAWKRPELRLPFIWSCVVFVFFSVSGSKLPPYILPLFPSIAILLGWFFSEKDTSERLKWPEITSYTVIFVIFASCAIAPLVPPLGSYLEKLSGDAPRVIRDLRAFSVLISLSSIAILVLLFFKTFRTYNRFFVCMSLFSLVLMVGLILNFDVLDRVNTSKNLARMINAEKSQADYVVNYSSYEQTLPFYTKQAVVLASYTGELAMGSKYADAQNRFISEGEFMDLISSKKKVLFVTKQKRVQRLQSALPGRLQVRGCQNDRCLMANY